MSGRYPGEGHGNLLQYFCLENSHGQRRLESYSLWGLKESDMTARLSTAHTFQSSTVCVCVKSLQLCSSLCDPMDYILPASSAHGILQATILEWVVIHCSRGSSPPRDPTQVSCIAGRFFYHLSHHGKGNMVQMLET